MTQLAKASTAIIGEPAIVQAGSPALRVEIADDLAAIEPLWRQFEAGAIGTPFQRFDWVRAFWNAGAQPGEIRIVVARDAAQRPQMLLPLVIETRGGLRVARVVGGKQASFHAPLIAPGLGARLSQGEVRGMLVEIGRRLGIDALCLSNMPLQWQGERNPLAIGGQPSPSFGWRLSLDSDGEATLARSLSRGTRRNFRKKERKLAELGPVRHQMARTPQDIDEFLAAFLKQKRERSRAAGLPNPFEQPAIQTFLHAGCRAGLDQGHPAIELHALRVGDRIAAVVGVAADRLHGSGMFLAFDGEPAIARASPAELLLIHVIDAQCRAGRRAFDLGVGEAFYKRHFSDAREPLIDLMLPFSLRGRAFAAFMTTLVAAKRSVKQTPWAARLVASLPLRAGG